MTEYIDLTPTWEGMLPAILALFECGQPDVAKAELKKMAQVADKWNDFARTTGKNVVGGGTKS